MSKSLTKEQRMARNELIRRAMEDSEDGKKCRRQLISESLAPKIKAAAQETWRELRDYPNIDQEITEFVNNINFNTL